MQSIVHIDKRIVCVYYILHQILKTKVSDIQGPGVICFHTFISLYLVEEEAPSSSWTVCSSLKATRFSVPDLEEPPFLVAGVGGCGGGCWGSRTWGCFFDACEDEEEAGESPCNMKNRSLPISQPDSMKKIHIFLGGRGGFNRNHREIYGFFFMETDDFCRIVLFWGKGWRRKYSSWLKICRNLCTWWHISYCIILFVSERKKDIFLWYSMALIPKKT